MNKLIHRHLLVACLTLGASPLALALEATWSGFATVGYALSDSDFTTQRFISRSGSFKRDSLVAGQLDLQLAPQWSATVQARVTPSDTSDSKWEASAAWALLAWRPDNDWLLRLGKVRVPLYLVSESLDVGVSHDMARMPHEMYSISPSNDFTGLFVTRNFGSGQPDISLDLYSGQSDATARFWLRDGLPPYVPAGATFQTVKVKLNGLALTARDTHLTWRLGLHSTSSRRANGEHMPVRYPRVDVGPGLGYWKVDDALPGPEIERVARIRNLIATAGAEWQFDDGWRVAAEFVRMHQRDTEVGADSSAGYVALFKRMGAFTPYVSLARQRSSSGVLEWQRRLTQDRLPDAVPGAAQINAAQRMAGETLYAFDQHSVALGLSYATSSTQKLKLEWMHTRTGATSKNFDTPAGTAGSGGLRVNTLSANYNVAF